MQELCIFEKNLTICQEGCGICGDCPFCNDNNFALLKDCCLYCKDRICNEDIYCDKCLCLNCIWYSPRKCTAKQKLKSILKEVIK